MTDKRMIVVKSCEDCPRKYCSFPIFRLYKNIPASCPLSKLPSVTMDDLAKHIYGKNLKDLKDYWGDESIAGWEECKRVLDAETDWLKSIGVEI